LGKAISGKKAGEVVQVVVPAGEREYKIVKVG
jgi:transcription elongation GreA/GreB family factor